MSRSLIVLAEDNAELRALLADGLERSGFAVVRARDGRDLVERVREIAVDGTLALIVTDVRMPVLDGIAAVQSLRDAGITTPVIFMTAYGDSRTRSVAENLNSRWIDKPIGLNALRSAVGEVLGVDVRVPDDPRP